MPVEYRRPNEDILTEWWETEPPGIFDSGTEDLYVNGRIEAGRNDWEHVGTSPYLDVQDEPVNLIKTQERNVDDGDYTFQDYTEGIQWKIIKTARLFCYHRVDDDNDNVIARLWDGSAWRIYYFPNRQTWGWDSVDIKTHFDSWAKINGAKLYCQHQVTGKIAYVYADCFFIRVEWEQPNPHYSYVDDDTGDPPQPDDGATYISTGFSSYPNPQTDKFGLPDTGITEGTITRVRHYARTRMLEGLHEPDFEIWDMYLYVAGTRYVRRFYKGSAWQTFYGDYNNNPNTGQPWQISELNTLEIGIWTRSTWCNRHSTYEPFKCTQKFIATYWTPPAVGYSYNDGLVSIQTGG